MKPSAIIFDMAGTTVDEANIVYKTLHAALVQHQFAVSFETVLRLGAGKEKGMAIRDIILSLNVDTAPEVPQAVHSTFLLLLDAAYDQAAILAQPGAEDVFQFLRERGIKVVLNTGYDRATAERLVSRLDWEIPAHFDLLVTASDVVQGRPAPDMIHLACAQLGIPSPSSTIKVGDSVVDIEEGKNAGCGLTFGITTGAQSAELLASAHPDGILSRLTDLYAWID